MDPEEYAAFILILPSGPDPISDLESLLASSSTAFSSEAFFFSNISHSDVIRELTRLRGYRCVGDDGIHVQELWDGRNVLAPILVDIFNSIDISGVYPLSWKRSITKPIPKKSHPTVVSHHRPISFQPTPSKIFDGLILQQMTDHLEAVSANLALGMALMRVCSSGLS